ncbi:g10589 [Coccomyxa elongata]
MRRSSPHSHHYAQPAERSCIRVGLQITQQQKCRRVRAQAQAEESTSGNMLDEDSEPEVEVPSALAGNNKFAEALKAALKRSGGDAAVLTSGEPAKPRENEPPRPTALEEVLLNTLRDSRRNLVMLDQAKKELEGALEREKMQFERLQFAYQKATRDAAYARTVEMLLERERSKKASAQAAADAEENHAVPN